MCPVQYLLLEPFYLVPDDIPSSGLFGTLEKKWLLVLVKTLCIHRNCLWKVVISSRGSDVNCASRLYRSLKCVLFLNLNYCIVVCFVWKRLNSARAYQVACLATSYILFISLQHSIHPPSLPSRPFVSRIQFIQVSIATQCCWCHPSSCSILFSSLAFPLLVRVSLQSASLCFVSLVVGPLLTN